MQQLLGMSGIITTDAGQMMVRATIGVPTLTYLDSRVPMNSSIASAHCSASAVALKVGGLLKSGLKHIQDSEMKGSLARSARCLFKKLESVLTQQIRSKI